MLLLLAAALAPSLAALPQDPRPQLELESHDGTVRRIPLAGLELADPRAEGGWLVRPLLPAGPERRTSPAAADGALGRVELAGGDRISGRIVGGEGETLTVELAGGVRLPLRIDRLASLVFRERVPAAFAQDLLPPSEGDRVYRVSGASLDRIDGTVEEFTPEGVRFESRLLGSRVFAWEELAALFVEVLGEEVDAPPEGIPAAVDLVDLSRVRGTLSGLDEDGCRLSVAGDAEIRIPWERVEELLVVDGKLQFLSELPPAGEEGHGTPFDDDLGMRWPHRLDRAVVGGPLRAAGREYARGIGMHAPSRVRWELDGSWSSLRGKVAIDDSVLRNAEAARGAVVFRLHGDGEVLWESGILRGGDAPLPLPRISIEGVRELVLEADPAGDFAGDRADWLRVLLAR